MTTAADSAATSRPPRRVMPGRLPLFVQVVSGFGVAVIVHSLHTLIGTPHLLEWLLLAALAIATGSFTVKISSISARISVSDTFFITLAVLFGPAPVAVAIAADSGIMSWRRGHPWRRIVFNAAAPTISIWAAAQTFFRMTHVRPLAQADSALAPLIFPLLLLAIVYFALNSGLMATAIGLEARKSPVLVWGEHFSWLSLSYLAAGSASFCLILLIHQISLGAVAIVLPLVAVFYLTLQASFGRLEDARRHLGDMDRLYLSTVETLAMAIDAKDDVAHSHVRRVQAYAVGMARALGIADALLLKAIEAAALLHDTGKLAVPERILNKPGKLTESEFEKMKLHVDVGADILSLVDFPYPVVPIVRCHHENWDGTGYPRGVKGDEIPIGARILSVVDCFDALTSDRPYRKRMSDEAALEILRERSGRMYDPQVVDLFCRIYRDIDVSSADAPKRQEVMQQISRSSVHEGDPASASATQVQASGPAVSTDVLAFVSLARIASGEGSVADVLSLCSSLVADIAPNVTGAWYLPDLVRDRLIVAEAFGSARQAFTGASIGFGEGLTGWVSTSGQSMISADASLDPVISEESTPGLLACMSVPLELGGSLPGVLTLYAESTTAFEGDRGRMIEMIAPHLASAIQAARNNAGSKATPAAPEKSQTTKRDLRLVSKLG